MNREMKFLDVVMTEEQIDNDGTTQHDSMNEIPQNATASGRLGQTVVVRRLHWRYKLLLNERVDKVSPGASEVVRIIVYLDRQCNGAIAPAAELMNELSVTGHINLVNEDRFDILLDRTHEINYTAVTANSLDLFTQPVVIQIHSWNEWVNIPIEFDDASGAITGIRSNNIGIWMVSRTPNLTQVGGTMRVQYTDN